jgi:hypothetical protein
VSRLTQLHAGVWAPEHLSGAEVAEMVNDKLRAAGSVLVVEAIRVAPSSAASPEARYRRALLRILDDGVTDDLPEAQRVAREALYGPGA